MMKSIYRKFIRLLCLPMLTLSSVMPPHVGATSCKPEESGYSTPGNQVWFFSRSPDLMFEVHGVDAATFRDISPYRGEGGCAGRINDYARDNSHVFYRGKVIEGADPETFGFMERIYTKDIYTKDKHSVYYKEIAIKHADPASFTQTSSSTADDKNYRYENERVVCKLTPAAKGLVPNCRDASKD